METRHYRVKVTGIVQGVGFRPFVYAVAQSLFLKGQVINTSDGVIIDVEGRTDQLDKFLERLEKDAPLLARIKGIEVAEAKHEGFDSFNIERSENSEGGHIYISPDVGVCGDCRREIFSRGDRRYMYPFTNCTNCGPRFTIIKSVPYDRCNTTMERFAMCPECSREYHDPGDRRYHAQPVSCHDCGPRLILLDRDGAGLEVGDAVAFTCSKLGAGSIVAVKGLGGFHLACNARDADAVKRLRKLKARDEKPFALMVRDSDTAAEFCSFGDIEKELLESYKKPIVLLRKKEGCCLPEGIAPGNPYLGLMLPYTPLHLLILSSRYPENLDALVMTSGNRSSEPICYRDGDVLQTLHGIADFYLTNDRDIHIRTDDSVTRVFMGREYPVRRSRGYVPMPVTCSVVKSFSRGKSLPSILACGGELKNTFSLNRGDEFFISHHIGDLENFETLQSYEEGIEHFKRTFKIEPEAVAYDLHPEYLSTKYAMEKGPKVRIPVQHHHAHIASCMAENGLDGEVIGVAFDGTGYGEDGRIWGGEFFTGGYKGFKRAGHLEYVGMPGGEAAIREPWRMALSYLYGQYGNISGGVAGKQGLELNGLRIFEAVDGVYIKTVLSMLEKSINCPVTSSMGRLFDAVSALLGVRSTISYEGQAAVELENCMDEGGTSSYEFELREEKGNLSICAGPVINAIIEDMSRGVGIGIISHGFHDAAARMVYGVCTWIRNRSGLDRVVLSGGVFQNITLLGKCVNLLQSSGFKVYFHSMVPSNDGGICLGQAVIAMSKLLG